VKINATIDRHGASSLFLLLTAIVTLAARGGICFITSHILFAGDGGGGDADGFFLEHSRVKDLVEFADDQVTERDAEQCCSPRFLQQRVWQVSGTMGSRAPVLLRQGLSVG